MKKIDIDKYGFLRAINPKRHMRRFFTATVGISAVLYLLISLMAGDGHLLDIFFIRGQDFFMDSFNSIRDAAQGSGVYSERGVIYPPMANLIFLILSVFTPRVYNNTDFSSRYSWTAHRSCYVLAAVVIAVFCIVLFYTVYAATKRGSTVQRILFALTIVISVPVIYLLERGNIIALCLLSLTVFALTYNSKLPWKREVGLIALAFAFSIKLYPVVFGWLLIKDKRYKEIVRCVIYGAAMLIIPSFFFGGPIFCAKHLFGNIFGFSTGSGNTISVVMNFFHFPAIVQSIVNALIYLWVFVCGACFAISPFIRGREQWKTWVIGLVTIMCVPSLTGIYSWSFFIIPIIMMANIKKQEFGRDEMLYFVFMTVPFIFVPFRFTYHVAPTDILLYAMTIALSVHAVRDTLNDFKRARSEKKGLSIESDK